MLTIEEMERTRLIPIRRPLLEVIERQATSRAKDARFPDHANALHTLARHFRLAMRETQASRIEIKGPITWFRWWIRHVCTPEQAFELGQQLGYGG